jgi:hypothetical protein
MSLTGLLKKTSCSILTMKKSSKDKSLGQDVLRLSKMFSESFIGPIKLTSRVFLRTTRPIRVSKNSKSPMFVDFVLDSSMMDVL